MTKEAIVIVLTIASTNINVYCVHSVTVSHISRQVDHSTMLEEQHNNIAVSDIA